MSTIAVIGGTGYAGSSIVKDATSRGHRVISLSRSLPAEPVDGVTYVQGTAADPEQVVTGADVVIGALSPRAGTEGTLVPTYTKLADLAAAAGARLIVVGGFSSLRPAPGAPRFAEGELPSEFAAEASEGDSVLTALSTSTDVALFDADGSSAIEGPDFALAIVDEIEKPTRHRSQIHFAY